MIVVDSSVWIDYLRGKQTRQVTILDDLLGVEALAIGDLMLAEILQGIDSDREFNRTRKMLTAFTLLEICDKQVAIEAAMNYRRLRKLGITVRKTIDAIIATRCIQEDHALLYSDQDFDPFVKHLGLRSAA